ncbi:MAG: 4-(cytidine 5'-diphospho)-2-C-methyl-D-erythritol kinase [Rhodospirillaceae bacterium]|nr:4-(cytidine 5'-diphospho)-2-C-methyl-D-erythritol kinase [Rhodospirillaceae bacterium]
MPSVSVFAPAKINLCLHITGKRADGYHLLESLVAFADIGDVVSVSDSADLQLTITGPFSKALSDTEGNSTLAAARFLAKAAGRQEPTVNIELTKNLPVASGIGGGSGDAAAALLACQSLWHIHTLPGMPLIAAGLGADVPVCLGGLPTFMSGIGENLSDIADFPKCDVVLVNPGVALPTANVFGSFRGPFSKPFTEAPLKGWAELGELLEFMRLTRNDLTTSAVTLAPDITRVLSALSAQPGCALARMSGSGATCFGLFHNPREARAAADAISTAQPLWWVKAGQLLPHRPLQARDLPLV